MKKDINKKIIIGFSIGDYNSIGPEIFLKSFSSTNLFKNCIPIIFCEESILEYYKKKFKINIKIKALENLDSIKDQKCIYTFSSKRKEIIPKPGEINKDAGNYAIKSLNDLFKRLSVAMFPSFNEKLNISLLKNDASLIFTRLVEYILSQILGTAGKKSGWISTKSDWTVSVDSEKLIVAINCVAIKRSVSLAKIWHRGR